MPMWAERHNDLHDVDDDDDAVEDVDAIGQVAAHPEANQLHRHLEYEEAVNTSWTRRRGPGIGGASSGCASCTASPCSP